MQNNMKKIISLVLICATSSLMALGAEHAYLYKDPRIMGMGGANIAVGGYSTSIFSNPAGLAKLDKKNGMIVDIFGLGASTSSKTLSFISDINNIQTDANINPNATNDMIALLSKYSGKYFHVNIDNYTSVSNNGDDFAWSIGLLSNADVNYMVHANGGASFLETTTRVYGGVVLGGAKKYTTEIGDLDIGLGLKYIKQTSVEGGLTINDLLNNGDLAKYLQDKYKKDSSGFGLDIGAILSPFKESYWHPSVGLSILNIGSMGMDNNYGAQPMTVNIGASVSPEVPVIESLTLAVDYVDMFNANKVRFYDINGKIASDLSESDFMKRLRLGVGIGLINSTFFSMKLNGGFYQSAYTAGIDLEVAIFKISLATYQEEVGTAGASNTDRRYMAKLGFGW